MIEYTKERPLRVFEAFAGYGSQSLALKRLKENYPGFDFVPVGFSEIEPSAITAYKALHGDVRNYGDITQISWEEVPDFDLFTMSSPCQDFSSAGRQLGGEEGSGTRSSLLWECTKAIDVKRPRFVLFENVAAVASSKFVKGFNKWQKRLADFGYVNFSQLINSKDFGVPQNRLRLFMVSILRTEDDPDPKYYFPKPFPLTKRLKDVLEEHVDEKYYLSDERVQGLFDSTEKESERGNGFAFKPQDGGSPAHAITTKEGCRKTNNFLFDFNDE